MRYLFTMLAAVLAIVLLPAAAHAGDYHAKWGNPRVCVETKGHVSGSWRVGTAMRKWSRNTPATFYRRSDCPRYNRVTIRQVHKPASGWAGVAKTWVYLRRDNRLAFVRILLNTGNTVSGCYRRTVTTHELGHALGLNHQFGVFRSIMSYSRWMRRQACGTPSAYDYRLVRRAY